MMCVCFGGGGLFNPLWYIFLIKSNLWIMTIWICLKIGQKKLLTAYYNIKLKICEIVFQARDSVFDSWQSQEIWPHEKKKMWTDVFLNKIEIYYKQSRMATTRHGTIRKSKTKKIQSIQESQKIVIYFMQGTTATIRCGATRKRRAKKIKSIQKSCFVRMYSTDKKRLIILDLIHRS